MDNQFIQAKSAIANNKNTIDIVLDSPVRVGDLLHIAACAIKSPSPANVSSITDNLGNSYVINDTVQQQSDAAVAKLSTHHCLVTVGGACTITVNFSANNDLIAGVVELLGLLQLPYPRQPESSAATTGQSTTPAGPAATPVTQGDCYVGTYMQVTTNNESVTATWGTARVDTDNTTVSLNIATLENGTGSQTPTWSVPNSDFYAAITTTYRMNPNIQQARVMGADSQQLVYAGAPIPGQLY